MNVTKYLKQSATLRKKTGQSHGWATSEYGDPITIRARIVQKMKYVKTNDETSAINVTEYMTDTEIHVGDELDGEQVLGVETVVDKKGRILLYSAYPRPPQGFIV